MNSATRLGYDIDEIMSDLIENAIEPEPSLWTGMRGNNTIGDLGRAANIGIIQDSLLQSNEGFLNIFANWYDDQETKFRRLRANGAFLVDADMNEFGQVTYVNILSEKGSDCSVLNPWQEEGSDLEVYKNGENIETEVSQNNLGDIYTFKTEPGVIYELKPSGELADIIKVNTAEAELYIEDTLQLEAVSNVEDEIPRYCQSCGQKLEESEEE